MFLVPNRKHCHGRVLDVADGPYYGKQKHTVDLPIWQDLELKTAAMCISCNCRDRLYRRASIAREKHREPISTRCPGNRKKSRELLGLKHEDPEIDVYSYIFITKTCPCNVHV